MDKNVNKELIQAAWESTEAYNKNAKEEGIEVIASWKETTFFIDGALWMQKQMIDKAIKFVHNNYDGYDGADFERELRKVLKNED